MQPNHKQTKDKISNPKETLTTNTKTKIKLHKTGIPIRPVINNMKAPSYKPAKHVIRHIHKPALSAINTMRKSFSFSSFYLELSQAQSL